MVTLHPATVIEAVEHFIIAPSPAGFWPLFLLSFFNDLTGVFPFAIVIAGELAFYKGAFTALFVSKLFLYVAVPIGLGSALGSVPLYLLAYFGGRPLINKSKRFLRITWEDIEKARAYFKGSWYDEIVFLAYRSAPILPSIPLDLASGLFRMELVSFTFLTAVGSIIRMMATLMIVGTSLHGLSQL